MKRPRPTVTHLTTSRWGGSYPRVAGWLRDGFRAIGRPYDTVFLEGPAGVDDDGCTRSIRLGRGSSAAALVPFARYLRESRPQLTLVKPPSLAISAIFAGRVIGRTVVPWEPSFKRQETDTGPRLPRLYFRARESTYRLAPFLTAVSDDVAAALRREFPDYGRPVITIPNPIDAADVRRRAMPRADRGHGLEFCAIGRMAEEKGYDVMLKAFARASLDLGRHWRLRIFGKGPRLEEMRRLAVQVGVGEHVEFHGWVENPYPYLAAADVLVHAARFEPFGLVYTEALSLGVPVVATDCPGGPASIFEAGYYGVLTPVGDDEALTAGILRLAGDPGLRRELADRGPERAKSYAPDVIAQRMASIADSLEEAGSGSAGKIDTKGDR